MSGYIFKTATKSIDAIIRRRYTNNDLDENQNPPETHQVCRINPNPDNKLMYNPALHSRIESLSKLLKASQSIVPGRILVLALVATCTLAKADVSPSIGVEDVVESGLNTPLRNAARTYQAYYGASTFAAVTEPTTFTGIQFRLAIGENWRPAGYVGASWPDAGINFSSFTITLAKATPQLITDGEFLSLSPTFASYMSSPVVVRTGSLSFGANSFAADGGAAGIHSWGQTISFSTSYTLNPGETLVMLINHSGYGAAGTPLQAFFASGAYQPGVTDAISSTASGTATVPNGFSSPLIVNFVTVPEPALTSLVALGGLVLIAARRRMVTPKP